MSGFRWSGILAVVIVLLLVAVALWLYVGFWPQQVFPDLAQAGEFGDSFGFVNSLFSSFAFALVALALILQLKELHDTSRSQHEQARMQLEQMQISERTARIQEAMRLDSRRRLAMEAFLKINRDTMDYRHALLAWHPENKPPTSTQLEDQQNERQLKRQYFDAWTALRSNSLSVGLIFDKQGDRLGKAIQDLYATAHRWVERGAPQCPPAAKCEQEMNQQIRVIEEAMRPLWESLAPEFG